MWNRKGNILCFLKKYEESQQCYDKVKELNPNDYEIKILEFTNTLKDLTKWHQSVDPKIKNLKESIRNSNERIADLEGQYVYVL